jgi:chromosome segregation ATPase
LRSEKDNLLEQNAALKSRLASAESANEPFLQEIRDLKAQILALNAEKSVLQEEVSRWMKKVESLIHSYNQVDLAEYEQLQGEYKDLSDVNKSLVGKLEKLESLEMNFEKDSAAKLDHLKLEYETKLSLKQTEYDELKKSELGRAGRLSKTIKTQQSEIDNLKAELEAQAAALSTPAPTAQSQVQVGASPQEVKDLIDLIEKSKKLISELKEKVEKLQEELRLKSME